LAYDRDRIRFDRPLSTVPSQCPGNRYRSGTAIAREDAWEGDAAAYGDGLLADVKGYLPGLLELDEEVFGKAGCREPVFIASTRSRRYRRGMKKHQQPSPIPAFPCGTRSWSWCQQSTRWPEEMSTNGRLRREPISDATEQPTRPYHPRHIRLARPLIAMAPPDRSRRLGWVVPSNVDGLLSDAAQPPWCLRLVTKTWYVTASQAL
jgi:hypothetical protein